MKKAYIVKLIDADGDTLYKLVDQETWDWIYSDVEKPEPKIKSFLGFSRTHDVGSWDDKSCPQSIRDRIEKNCDLNSCDFDGVEITAGSPYNDRAIQAPVLDDNYDDYEAWYAKTKDITRILKNARSNDYQVDIDNEYEGVMY